MKSHLLIQDTSLLAHVLFFGLVKTKKQVLVAKSSTKVIILGVLFPVIPSGLGYCVWKYDLHNLTLQPCTETTNNKATTILSHDSVPRHEEKCINRYLHCTK